MLSDSKHKAKIRSPNKRKVNTVSTKVKPPYSDSQKMDLVKTYLVTGNLLTACATLNIPYITGKTWKKTEWWAELTTDIKTEDTVQLSDKLKKLINKSLAITEDRLENGEMIYDSKEGILVSKPVSLKDAHKVAVDLMDRRQILENKPAEQTSVESVAAKLDAIAARFAEIASSKPVVQVTDVVLGEVIESDGKRC